MMLTRGIGSSKWKVALATVVFKLNEGNIFKLISTPPHPFPPSPTEAVRGSISSQDNAVFVVSRPPSLRVGSVVGRATSVNRERALIALGQQQPWQLLAPLKLSLKVRLSCRGKCVQRKGFLGQHHCWLAALSSQEDKET